MPEIKFLDLTADNAFDFCSVLDAVGMNDVVGAIKKEEIIALQKEGKDTKSIGLVLAMKMFAIVVHKLSSAREPIYSFLSGCAVWANTNKAVTVDELRKLKLSAFLKLMADFFKKDDLSDFFKDVAELMNMGQNDLKNS